ncbi:MAG: hypothetical protein WCX65_14510, partial [bacterium]
MKTKNILFLLVFAAAVILMPYFAKESRAQIAAVQISGDVPAAAADAIAGAGFDTVIIYYTPYRKPADPRVIERLKQWGAKAAKLKLNLYVKIDTGPPLDAVADTSAISYRRAASDDGYPLSHKPAPASADFWKTAIFPKLAALAPLSAQFPLKGVFINLDNHVGVSFDPETFAEFLKIKEPATDPNSITPLRRKEYLKANNLLADFEKYQEDMIYDFTIQYMKDLKGRAPNFAIELASYQDNPLCRAYMRVVKELQADPVMIMYTFHNAGDRDTRLFEGAKWIPTLSVREFPPEELAANVGALNLWKSGFAVANAESLWRNLKDINIYEWPQGLTEDYLKDVARAKKAADADAAEYSVFLKLISERVAENHSGAPKIALIYSGYKGYVFRDVFDGPLAAAGIKMEKFENSKLDKMIPKLAGYGAIFAAPGYNAVKSDKFMPYAKDILKFVENGGMLFILDGSLPQQIEWMGRVDPALSIGVEQKEGLSQKRVDTSFKMLGYSSKVTKFVVGKSHFMNPAPGWRQIAVDNDDKPYVVQRIYGQGMIVALANFDVNSDFMVNVWEHMLKVLDRFDVAIDPNMKPLNTGKNEVPFVVTTNGPARKLKVIAKILNQNRKMQTAEEDVTLTLEGGARFAVPLYADAAGLYQVTLTFFDKERGRVDRRETFSFLAPPPYEAQFEKSYYTKEPEALLRVACRRAEGCGKFEAKATLAGAAPKLKQSAAGFQMFALPISNMKPGDYTVKVAVKDKSDAGYSISLTLRKLPPSPYEE